MTQDILLYLSEVESKMKKLFCKIFLWVLIFLCFYGIYALYFAENQLKEYYVMEDFQDIKIGKSTFHDVYRIAPVPMIDTSYGGKCEYPMQDGKKIYIKFYEERLLVGEIGIN